ncbi:MAG: YbhB/YbcL family Raf kinase inhibitor-like protein [Acidobacteria bacterium]|nr:YbhB/YbcL family Raf kinase inhibitor-like protein [Acidobacteriota bacterium]
MRLVRWMAAAAIVPVLMMTAAAQQAPAPVPMRLASTSFPDGSVIPNKYTQVEKQVSPALTWTNASANTQSFVMHMHDMEGSRQKTTDDQLHWLVWNIPASTTSLPEGVPAGPDLKDGSHQTSANGNGTYRGPGAPAAGPLHHYVFEIFALDTKIDVPANAADPFETRTRVMAAIQGHIIGKAVYMGLFHRPE